MAKVVLSQTDEKYREIFDEEKNKPATKFAKAPFPLNSALIGRTGAKINQWCTFCGRTIQTTLSNHQRKKKCAGSGGREPDLREATRLFIDGLESAILYGAFSNPLDIADFAKGNDGWKAMEMLIEELKRRHYPIEGEFKRPADAVVNTPSLMVMSDKEVQTDRQNVNPPTSHPIVVVAQYSKESQTDQPIIKESATNTDNTGLQEPGYQSIEETVTQVDASMDFMPMDRQEFTAFDDIGDDQVQMEPNVNTQEIVDRANSPDIFDSNKDFDYTQSIVLNTAVLEPKNVQPTSEDATPTNSQPEMKTGSYISMLNVNLDHLFIETNDAEALQNGYIEQFSTSGECYGSLPLLTLKLAFKKHEVLNEFKTFLAKNSQNTIISYLRNFSRFMIPVMKNNKRLNYEMNIDDYISASPILLSLFNYFKQCNVSYPLLKQMHQSLVAFTNFAKTVCPPCNENTMKIASLNYMQEVLDVISGQLGLKMDPESLYRDVEEPESGDHAAMCAILDDHRVISTVKNIHKKFMETSEVTTSEWNFVVGHITNQIIHKSGLRDGSCYKLLNANVFPLDRKVEKRKENIDGVSRNVYILKYAKPKQARNNKTQVAHIVLDEDMWIIFQLYAEMKQKRFPDAPSDSTFFMTYSKKNVTSSSIDYLLANFYSICGFIDVKVSCNKTRQFFHTEEYRAGFQATLDLAVSIGTSTQSGHGRRTQEHVTLRRIRDKNAEKNKSRIEEVIGQIRINFTRKPRTTRNPESVEISRKRKDAGEASEENTDEPVRKVKRTSPADADCKGEETDDEIKQEASSQYSQHHRIQVNGDSSGLSEFVHYIDGLSSQPVVVKLEIGVDLTQQSSVVQGMEEEESAIQDRQLCEWECGYNSHTDDQASLLEIQSTQEDSPRKKSRGKRTRSIKAILVKRTSTRVVSSRLEEIARLALVDSVENRLNESKLVVFEDDIKGQCIKSGAVFLKGSFVVEYIGDLLTSSEAKRKELEYSHNTAIGSYMYFFKLPNGNNACIDATVDKGQKARLISHSYQEPNLFTKCVIINCRPTLLLLANRDISIGEESMFDYDDRDPINIANNPWLRNS